MNKVENKDSLALEVEKQEGLQRAWLPWKIAIFGVTGGGVAPKQLSMSAAFSGWLLLLLSMLQYVMYLEDLVHILDWLEMCSLL